MKTALLVTLLLFISLEAFPQQSEADRFFPVERSHSYIEFSVKYMGYAKVKGRFADFSGMIYYDDKDISKMSATITVKVESIDTDLDFRDNDLKSENWFASKEFPLIRFQSRKSVPTSQGFDVTGELTIKGITRDVVIHMNKPSGVVKDARSDAQVILTGTTSIKRSDFNVEGKNWSGVKEGITAVEDNVDLEFSLLGKQIKKDNFRFWVSNLEKPPGKLYALARDKGPTAAIEEFSKMKNENAVQQQALNSAAYMLQLEDRVGDAIQLLEANHAAFHTDAATLHELGFAYLRKGNKERAKEAFKLADAGDPVTQEVLRHL
jgi:polyisoprenoid-binding protein YceI